MSFERTQIVVPSSRFTGSQPIAIAVTSAAISSSIATATRYVGSTPLEVSFSHKTVTLHVLFFMFRSQVFLLDDACAYLNALPFVPRVLIRVSARPGPMRPQGTVLLQSKSAQKWLVDTRGFLLGCSHWCRATSRRTRRSP